MNRRAFGLLVLTGFLSSHKLRLGDHPSMFDLENLVARIRVTHDGFERELPLFGNFDRGTRTLKDLLKTWNGNVVEKQVLQYLKDEIIKDYLKDRLTLVSGTYLSKTEISIYKIALARA
jgi:hypothetical protein